MIIIKFNFFLTFKPFLIENILKEFKQIYCKFFFFILLFFEYYFTKFFFFFLLNKKKKKINNFLKAPHHYKIAQTKIERSFYILKLYFKIIFLFSEKNIVTIFNKLNIYNFSSSVIYLTNKHFFFYIRNFFLS